MVCILLIDDESAVRKVLRHMLEREGYDIVEAEDGRAGLRLYREHPTDLIIMDLLMPEKEGIETIIELRKTTPGAKIIAISGGGRVNKVDLLASALHLGAMRALAKPFDRQELMRIVKEVLTM